MKKEEMEQLEVGDRIYYIEGDAVGEIIPGKGAKKLNFSSDDIPEDKVPGIIPPEQLLKFPICEEEHENVVYSDKKNEWICPFCKEE